MVTTNHQYDADGLLHLSTRGNLTMTRLYDANRMNVIKYSQNNGYSTTSKYNANNILIHQDQIMPKQSQISLNSYVIFFKKSVGEFQALAFF